MAETATAAKAAREQLTPPLPERRAEWDCLLVAAQKGNAAFLKQILSDHPGAMAHSTPLGQTALHIAAWWGRTSCLRILLEHEPEQLEQQQQSSSSSSTDTSTDTNTPSSNSLVHRKGHSGATPLHECLASSAVRRSQSQRFRRRLCFEALLDAGADPNSRDAHQETPLDKLVVAVASPSPSPLASPEDASDRAFLEQLISDRERALPVKKVLKELESSWSTLEDVERMWREAVTLKPYASSLTSSSLSSSSVSSADTMMMMMMIGKLLSEAFAAKIGAWTMDPEEDNIVSQTTNGEPGEPMDHEWWSERIAWMWKKLVEMSEYHEGCSNDNDNNNDDDNNNDNDNDNDNDNNNDHGQESSKNASSRSCSLPKEPIGQKQQKALVTALATAIFRRYEHLCRTSPSPESSSPSRLRLWLRDDAALRCWTATMKLLLLQRKPESSFCSTAPYDNDNDNENALSKVWISIARRNYSELAELWWDTLRIAPTSIGIANRQGMTPLHFAARSGHGEMVRWMLGHARVHAGHAHAHVGRSDFETTKEWVLRTDRHGQTAFDAATANGHESVARLLREFELRLEFEFENQKPTPESLGE